MNRRKLLRLGTGRLTVATGAQGMPGQVLPLDLNRVVEEHT
jgi:hypothetical protein